ncbi:hypothetical protein A2438_01940 [candidate division WOR-1 bacterium RIFOXYC2_FULL_46_14]|uniref:N-acetyltransferase domain-containing protein n=1 Tax=candidate division WOR-1 bacterium RIFOXYC2_FULL_46_14 TaxID=1802587 RepID=A0A1F4U810_UNCSA|nr:MAG: hypothetical protein A2438_01940 [candidate division WOR-1 bacterium RIFOXYC2_FULL_46_14]
MIIRPAKEIEMGTVRELAEQFNLDSEEMPVSEFIVAEDKGSIVGFVRLKDNRTCFELTSLGVVTSNRNLGIGKKLVEAVAKKQPDNLYLATIIPDFFTKLGFKTVKESTECMKKEPAWCEGCPAPERCVIMKYDPAISEF